MSRCFAFLCVVLTGCRDKPDSSIPEIDSRSSAGDLPAVVATVDGKPITRDQLRSIAGKQLDALDMQYHAVRSALVEKAVDSLVSEQTLGAEARDRGMTIEQLVASEFGSQIEPGSAEINAWYESNRARLGNRPLASLREQIADLLRSERIQVATQRLQTKLIRERGVTYNFEPYRNKLDNRLAPAKGSASARVTLVEFSDFQCPFCHRFAATLRKIEEAYGDSVLIVYRQFPIASIHPFAMKAAEASLCANEQGKFWELHDKMFGDQTRLSVGDLTQKAADLGLDGPRFTSCLQTSRYAKQVEKDIEEASRLGVSGTPALFVNGVEIRGGAVPFETVASAIDKEFARARSRLH
jgi:protein-disulfide isomerase